MKLQDQVIPKEQAKKLKDLGISQESYFLINPKGEIFESWVVEGTEDVFYSAFTVSELGAMLPTETIITRKIAGWRVSYPPAQWSGSGGENVTLADLLASLLISLLEGKTITAEEANTRITH